MSPKIEFISQQIKLWRLRASIHDRPTGHRNGQIASQTAKTINTTICASACPKFCSEPVAPRSQIDIYEPLPRPSRKSLTSPHIFINHVYRKVDVISIFFNAHSSLDKVDYHPHSNGNSKSKDDSYDELQIETENNVVNKILYVLKKIVVTLALEISIKVCAVEGVGHYKKKLFEYSR